MSADPAGRPEAPTLQLRAPRRRVVRLSRKVLVGVGAVAAIALGAALIFALEVKPRAAKTAKELYNTDHRATADELATLPKDYSQMQRLVPRLGPPLPGDLARPMLGMEAAPALSGATARGAGYGANDRDAWQTSHLFAATAPRSGGSDSTRTAIASTEAPQRAGSGSSDPSQADRNLAFLDGPPDRRTVSTERIESAASPYVVQAGAVIAAALITGIRSDLPGQVTAQVTENVYDTPTGAQLLIPQGSRLIGLYDSQIAFGQSRVLLVWTRLIFPDGRSIVLERLTAADVAGYAGLQDGVDYHWGRLFLAAGVSSLLGVGAELGSDNGNQSEITRAIRDGFQDTVNQAGQRLVQRQIDVQPTLTIRPGFPVRVMINRDLVLEPYAS